MPQTETPGPSAKDLGIEPEVSESPVSRTALKATVPLKRFIRGFKEMPTPGDIMTETPKPIDRIPPLDQETKEITSLALQFEYENSSFLEETNPVTLELQEYLNKMKDPNAPSARVLIALNNEFRNSYTLPDGTIVINQALINSLDSIEEVVAVLAHEQTHFEAGHINKQQISWKDKSLSEIINSFLEGKGIGRVHEYHADIAVNAKMDTLGMDSMAFASAIRKLEANEKQSKEVNVDVVHGNSLDRALNIVQAHGIVDFASSVFTEDSHKAIPLQWKRDIDSSTREKLLISRGKRYEQLVQSVGPLVLQNHLRELFIRTQEEGISNKIVRLEAKQKLNYLGRLFSTRLRESGFSAEDTRSALMLILTEGATSRNLSFIKHFMRPADFSPSAFNLLTKMHKEGKVYEVVGIRPEKTEFPNRLLSRSFIFDYLLVNDKLKLDYKTNPLAAELSAERIVDRLKEIAEVIAQNYDQKVADGWFWQMNYQLVNRFIENNRAPYQIDPVGLAKDTTVLLDYLKRVHNITFDLRALSHLSLRVCESKIPSDIISHKVDLVLNIFLEKLRPKDKQFIDALNQKDNVYFTELIKNEPNQFLQKASDIIAADSFFDDEDRTWLLSIIQNLDLNITTPIEFLGDTTKNLQNAGINFDSSTLTSEMLFTYNQIAFNLDSIYLLTSYSSRRASRERVEFLNKFLSDQKTIVRLKTLPTPLIDNLLRRVISECTPYRSVEGNIADRFDLNQPYSSSSNDEVLCKLSPFGIIRDRLLSELNKEDRTQVVNAYIYYRSLFEGLYNDFGDQKANESFWGGSLAMAEEMAPLATVLLDSLGKLDLKNAPGAETIAVYRLLNQILPNDQDRNDILQEISDHLTFSLPFKEALVFLEQEALEGRISLSLLDRFVEKRVFTYSDFHQCKDSIARITDEIISKPRSSIGLLAILDKFMEYRSMDENMANLLQAALVSGSNDSKLKQEVAPLYWFTNVQQSGNQSLRGYHIIVRRNQVQIIGPAAHTFKTLDDILQVSYNLPELSKMQILRKLMLSTGGVLTQPRYHEELAKMVGAQIERHPFLTPLLGDIFASTFKAGDPVKIFTPIAQLLVPMMLKRPSSPGNIDAAVQRISRETKKDYLREHVGYEGRAPNKWNDRSIREILGNNSASIMAEVMQRQPGTRALYDLYKGFITNLRVNLGLTESADNTSDQPGKISPIDAIIEVGQALGPPGKRFLQVMGQYFDIPADYAERFRSVYDSAKGQSKYTAFAIMERIARTEQATSELLHNPSFRMIKRVGGGSINTTFLIETRDKDDNPTLEVLKVKNPNAERIVIETIREAEKIIEEMMRRNPGQKANYEVAKRMLSTIQEWVLGDIEETDFTGLDRQFRISHNEYRQSAAIVEIPEISPPYNKFLKREEFVAGRTLNYLINELGREGSTPQTALARQTADVTAHLFARQLTNASYYIQSADGAVPVYLALSDIHSGNVMVMTPEIVESVIAELTEEGLLSKEDATHHINRYQMQFRDQDGQLKVEPRIKPIDRTFYMRLNSQDVNFMKAIVSEVQPEEKLRAMTEYFLAQPENAQRVSEGVTADKLYQDVYGALFRTRVIDSIRSAMRGRRSITTSISLMNNVLHELDKRSIVVPLRIRIMMKNVEAVNKMQQDVGNNGQFIQYLNPQAS